MPREQSHFKQGQSGNPAGRPKGSRNRASLSLDAILEGEAEAITRKAVEMAKGGDTVAMRMCLDRLCPPRRDRVVPFALPPLKTPADAVKAMAALVGAVAAGDLTPGEATDLSRLVADFSRTSETADLAARIAALEAKAEGRKAQIVGEPTHA